MRTSTALAWLASTAALFSQVAGQTYTNCNPLTTSCPPNSALGKTVNIDFSAGASDSFTPQGNPSYSSNGVSFTVAKSGDSPQLTSKWYIMFGRVDVVVKAAPGAGIVSSFVLQSDDLDEIDWEWLGADANQVQTNYFGKGQTGTYNRGAFHADSGSQTGFKTYTIIWTASQVVWQINGVTVRTLLPGDSNSQYPQTPMQVKIGAWSGGDSANSQGTIQWARGPTDYSKGPYSMQVKSLKVQDYSTGSQYVYSDKSGNWQSIKAVGGSVNSGGSAVQNSGPAVTSSVNGQPIPFGGSRSGDGWITPSVYPWVPLPSTLSTAIATTYPGLPSGWTVSSSGKLIPPSSAPTPSLPELSTSSPSASASAQSLVPAGYEVVTVINQQGFQTVVTQPIGFATAARSYDSAGFPITGSPSTGPTARATTAPAPAASAAPVQSGTTRQTDRSGRITVAVLLAAFSLIVLIV